jgi:hypothetical protein
MEVDDQEFGVRGRESKIKLQVKVADPLDKTRLQYSQRNARIVAPQ